MILNYILLLNISKLTSLSKILKIPDYNIDQL